MSDDEESMMLRHAAAARDDDLVTDELLEQQDDDGDTMGDATAPGHSSRAHGNASPTTVAHAILHFLRTFSDDLAADNDPSASSSSSSVVTYESLSDGIYFYRLLHLIEPDHFDLDDVPTTSIHSTDQRLKIVRQLLVAIESYLEELPDLALTVEVSSSLSAERICDAQRDEVQRLAELVLFCMVNSRRKEIVIERIMSMDDTEQEQLMIVIHEVMARYTQVADSPRHRRESTASSLDDSHLLNTSSLNHTTSSTSSSSISAQHSVTAQLEARVAALEQHNAELLAQAMRHERDEREWKKREVELQRRLDDLAVEHERATRQAVQQAVQEAERVYAQTSKNESARHSKEIKELEFRIGEMTASFKRAQEKEIAFQREKVSLTEKWNDAKEELKRREDEMHILRHKAEQATVLEAKLQRTLDRLEKAGDMQAQFQQAEEQATQQMEQIVSLERELKDMGSLKTQLAKYKEQVVTLQQETLEMRIVEDRQKVEMDELREHADALKVELRSTNDQLRSLQSELNDANIRLKSAMDGAGTGGAGGGLGLHEVNLREQLSRLQLENSRLRSELRAASDASPSDGAHGSDGTGAGGRSSSPAAAAAAAAAASNKAAVDLDVQNELDVTRELVKATQAKYVDAQKKITQLESQIRKLNAASSTASSSTDSNSSSSKDAEIARLLNELAVANARIAQSRSRNASIMTESLAAAATGTSGAGGTTTSSSNATPRLNVATSGADAAFPDELFDVDESAPSSSAPTPSHAASAAAASATAPSTSASTSSTTADLASITDLEQLRARLAQLSRRNAKFEATWTHAQTQYRRLYARWQLSQRDSERFKQTNVELMAVLDDLKRQKHDSERVLQDRIKMADRERKMMSTAFHSLGMELQQMAMLERPGRGDRISAKSWLNQQRIRPIDQQ